MSLELLPEIDFHEVFRFPGPEFEGDNNLPYQKHRDLIRGLDMEAFVENFNNLSTILNDLSTDFFRFSVKEREFFADFIAPKLSRIFYSTFFDLQSFFIPDFPTVTPSLIRRYFGSGAEEQPLEIRPLHLFKKISVPVEMTQDLRVFERVFFPPCKFDLRTICPELSTFRMVIGIKENYRRELDEKEAKIRQLEEQVADLQKGISYQSNPEEK